MRLRSTMVGRRRLMALLGAMGLALSTACGVIAPDAAPTATDDAPEPTSSATPPDAARPDASVPVVLGDASTCATTPLAPTGKGLFLVLDASHSFAASWSAAAEGTTTFLATPRASSLSLGAFVTPKLITINGTEATTCNDGVPPDVSLGLPGTTTNAIDNALAKRTVASGASTADKGIRGAAKDAQAFLLKQPANAVAEIAIVLVTASMDQEIAACPIYPSAPVGPPAVASEAAKALAQASPVYVIGLGSPNAGIDSVASAGGTEQATWLDPTTDVASGISSALSNIASNAFRCHFAATAVDLTSADPARLKVTAKGADGKTRELPHVEDCTTNAAGWRFDDAATRRAIVFCADSCAAVEGGDTAVLDTCAATDH